MCMCCRVGDSYHYAVPGTILNCFNCAHPIHVSTGTSKTMIAHPYIPVYICMECAVEYAGIHGKFTPQKSTGHQLQEMVEHARRANCN